jgi:hypothetical protein
MTTKRTAKKMQRSDLSRTARWPQDWPRHDSTSLSLSIQTTYK